MKNVIVFLLISFCWYGFVNGQLVNDGCMITVQEDALLHVQGDFTNQGGSVNNDGLIEIGGDFFNLVATNPLGTGQGVVSFVGTNQLIGGSFNTMFHDLSIEGFQRVQLGRNIGIGNSISIGDGIVDLNGNILHLINPNQSALTVGSGGVLSNSSADRVRWDLGVTGIGNYRVPFVTSSLEQIPLGFNITSAGVGSQGHFLINTYETTVTNLPLPPMVSNINLDGDVSGLNVVDRFWTVDVEEYSTNPTTSISFEYEDLAVDQPNTINENSLEVIQWDNALLEWAAQPSTTTSNRTVTTQNITSFGDFSLRSEGIDSDLNCPNNLVLSCGIGGGVVAEWDEPTYAGTCGDCNDGEFIPGFIYMGSMNGSKYYCSLSYATWPEAKNRAEQNGGHLAQIDTEEENAFLASKLLTNSAWIGLNDEMTEGSFVWSDGSPLNYSNWHPGQPNNFSGIQDYTVLMSSGLWNDDYNNYQREFIIEVPCNSIVQTSGPAPGTFLSAGVYQVSYEINDCDQVNVCSFSIFVEGGLTVTCPSDIEFQATNGTGTACYWDEPTAHTCCTDCGFSSEPISGFVYMGYYNGSHYYCSTSSDSWEDAQQNCLSHGGSLAKIDSEGENEFLANLLLGSAWIGASDVANEGEFVWTDGTPVSYRNWYPGQPNNYSTGQDYVELLKHGEWNDQKGLVPLEYIMEFSGCINITQIEGPAQGTVCPLGSHDVSYLVEDDCGNSEICSFSITVSAPTPTPSSYCSSNQNSTSKVYIQSLIFNSISNNSGNNGGYSDFTNFCTTVNVNSSYWISAAPGFADPSVNLAYWSFFIDYNGDGDFNDSNEFIGYARSSGHISGFIPIPYNAKNGQTRMRCIVSSENFITDPCADLVSGEVEDYCILISGGTFADDSAELDTRSIEGAIVLESSEPKLSRTINAYPNPVSEFLNIQVSEVENIERINVLSSDGRIVKKVDNYSSDVSSISVKDLEEGIYLLKVKYVDGEILSKLIIVQ